MEGEAPWPAAMLGSSKLRSRAVDAGLKIGQFELMLLVDTGVCRLCEQEEDVMHTIYLRIDEDLDESSMRALRDELRGVGHITDVEVHVRTPHDMLVEFEEEYISPMAILRELGRHGVHADIVGA